MQFGVFIGSCELLFSWKHWLLSGNEWGEAAGTITSSPRAQGQRLAESHLVGSLLIPVSYNNPTGQSLTCSPQEEVGREEKAARLWESGAGEVRKLP